MCKYQGAGFARLFLCALLWAGATAPLAAQGWHLGVVGADLAATAPEPAGDTPATPDLWADLWDAFDTDAPAAPAAPASAGGGLAGLRLGYGATRGDWQVGAEATWFSGTIPVAAGADTLQLSGLADLHLVAGRSLGGGLSLLGLAGFARAEIGTDRIRVRGADPAGPYRGPSAGFGLSLEVTPRAAVRLDVIRAVLEPMSGPGGAVTLDRVQLGLVARF